MKKTRSFGIWTQIKQTFNAQQEEKTNYSIHNIILRAHCRVSLSMHFLQVLFFSHSIIHALCLSLFFVLDTSTHLYCIHIFNIIFMEESKEIYCATDYGLIVSPPLLHFNYVVFEYYIHILRTYYSAGIRSNTIVCFNTRILH